MLSGEGNENGEKTKIGLISKKATLHVNTLFCTFLCRCFGRLQRKTSRNFLVTRFMKELSYVFLFTFFHCCSFSPWWPQAFLTFTAATKCSCCSSNKQWLLCFLSLALTLCRPFSLLELRWRAAHFLFFTVHKTRVAMRFHAKITSSCIWVAIPVIWVILRWYSCGADGRADGKTVTWLPKFLEWVDYHIFLGMGLRLRASGAPLKFLFSLVSILY